MRLLTAKRLQTIIAACAVLLAVPSAAVARSGPFTAVRATGKTQRGSFLGQITVSRFTVKKSGLAAVVLLTGTLQDARYPQVVAVREPGLTLRVTVRGKGCSPTVSIGPDHSDIWGLFGTLSARRIALKGACKVGSAHGAAAQAAALERLRRARG